MKKLSLTTLFVTFAIFCSAYSYATKTGEEAIKDWSALQQSYNQMAKEIEPVVPSYAPNIIGTDYTKVLATLDNYEKNMKPALEKQLNSFTENYGKTSSEINEKMKSIVKNGEHPSTPAGNIYENLKKFMNNVEQAKIDKSDVLVQDAKNIQRTIDTYPAQANQQNYDKLKQALDFAIKFNPKNEKAKDMLSKIDEQRKEKFAAFDKKINDAKWPGNYKNFAGPGNPNELAAIALEYFKNDKGWGANKKNKEHCLAVAIRGDWGSHKKNLLGQTVQWYLPVYLAVYSDKSKDKTVARVFELSLLTKEEPNVKKSPPFTGITVGNIWKIKRKNVPEGGSSDGNTGLINTLFWLGLALGNIIAGILAAAPLLKQKIPHLNKVYNKLTPLSNIIGVIVLAIGTLSLLGAVAQLFMLRFVIFSNILPQLAAMAVGLFLGKELLLKKPNLPDKAGKTAEKAQELLKKYDDKIRLLEMYQIPLGLSCIVIGLLHLLISNAPLF
ncbi:MAG: hypothetical protein DRI44_06485 [Chlamydiae bacterium]|nr:MAG: hypothetical protein DRI44_06485 [Chlamydiota bacterium]